jgi:hypothetical protein
MHIEFHHTLGKQEAVRRIDGWIDAMKDSAIPAGVTVEDFTKTWADNVLTVSCRVKKLFFGANVSAVATVNDDVVVIELELPGVIKALLPEEKVRQGLEKQILPLLA